MHRERRALTFDRCESLSSLAESAASTDGVVVPVSAPGPASAASVSAPAPTMATGGTKEASAARHPSGPSASERKRRLVHALQCVKKARSEQPAPKPPTGPGHDVPCEPCTPSKRTSVGSVIFDMLTERAAEKTSAAKAHKAATAEVKVLKKAGTKGKGRGRPPAEAGTQGKGRGRPPAKTSPKVPTLTAAAVKSVAKKGAEKPEKPSFSVERSRSQVLIRTGYLGYGSITLKYGKGKVYRDEAAAVEAGKKYLKDCA